MVPDGWKLVEAKEVCQSISVGVVIKPSQYYVTKGDKVKAFRSANVREGFTNDTNWVYFSPEGHELNKKSRLITGVVLKRLHGFNGEWASGALGDAVGKIYGGGTPARNNPSYWGGSIPWVTIKGVQVEEVKALKMTIPSTLEEQVAIVKILSAADREIQILQQKLTHLKQEKKALMQQLLTGRRRVTISPSEEMVC